MFIINTNLTTSQSARLRALDNALDTLFSSDLSHGVKVDSVLEKNQAFLDSLPDFIRNWVDKSNISDEELYLDESELGDGYGISAAYVAISIQRLKRANTLEDFISIRNAYNNDLSDLRSWSEDWDIEKGIWK